MITCRKTKFAGRRAFTLIELVCAMAILFIIVQLCAKLFHQGTVAWATGTRRADINITARAVMDFMARELSQAVADSHLTCSINENGDGVTPISFVTLTERGGRSAIWVQYSLTGNREFTRTVRRPRDPAEYVQDPTTWSDTSSDVLAGGTDADGVVTLRFHPNPGGSYTANLPRWVDMVLVIRPAGEATDFNDRTYVSRVCFDNWGRSK